MYKYDVWICFFADLIVDCLYTLNSFGEVFEYSFNMTYDLITNIEEHPILAGFSQITGRLLGACLWSYFIKGTFDLICSLLT